MCWRWAPADTYRMSSTDGLTASKRTSLAEARIRGAGLPRVLSPSTQRPGQAPVVKPVTTSGSSHRAPGAVRSAVYNLVPGSPAKWWLRLARFYRDFYRNFYRTG